ncbi:hypothetical protein [Paenibacillus tundrae]
MEFNFDEVFKRISDEEIYKVLQEIKIMKKREDEYDSEYILAHMVTASMSANLVVTKRVLEEYHQFLTQKISE